MKIRDIQNYLHTHPYLPLINELYKVTYLTSYKLDVISLKDHSKNYWLTRKFFTQHKRDIKLFITKREAIIKYPEYFI